MPICFRTATYNIHKSKGVDWRIRPARIGEVLREISADVVALQEVLEAACGSDPRGIRLRARVWRGRTISRA